MSEITTTSWPPRVRGIVLAAAKHYYQQMNQPFAAAHVAMERALEWATREIEQQESRIYEEASARWIARWESGKFEADMKRAIDAAYADLRRAERPLRAPARARKSRAARLNAEIAESLAARRR